MCDPITAGVALTTIGTGMGALQASSQARYAARVADRNAGLEREAAQQEIANSQESALAHYRQVAAMKGAQRARAAANGVGVDWGTAGDLQADTQALAREDTARIYRQGHERLRARDMGAANYSAEASAQRSTARAALAKGVLDMGTSVLAGSTQFGGPANTPAAPKKATKAQTKRLK